MCVCSVSFSGGKLRKTRSAEKWKRKRRIDWEEDEEVEENKEEKEDPAEEDEELFIGFE